MDSSGITTDPVLVRFREALTETYADRLERFVLFGSRARGDARPESDYDIALFLRNMGNRYRELDRLAAAAGRGDNLNQINWRLERWLTWAGNADNERTPLMREIRLEGVHL